MKTPWKFLLDLASRGRSAESGPATDTPKSRPPSAPVAPPVAVPTVLSDARPTEAAPSEIAKDLNETKDIAVEVVGDKGHSPLLADRTGIDERAGRPMRQPSVRRARASKSVAATARDGAPDVDAPRMTFSDEVTALDEEVRQLRRELAAKLSLQNAQLKKMLERF